MNENSLKSSLDSNSTISKIPHNEAFSETGGKNSKKKCYNSVFTNSDGIDSFRLLWNEEITFTNNDISIVDENSQPISESTAASNTQFMIIVFGETLQNDKYKITVNNTVLSTDTGAAIHGDENELAGGDAIIVQEHRKREGGAKHPLNQTDPLTRPTIE